MSRAGAVLKVSLQFKFRIVTRRLITVIGIVVHLFLPQVKQGQGKDQREPIDAHNGSNQRSGPPPALVKAEVPWSARRGTLSEKDQVLKTVKGILNKMTPEKYDLLKGQLIDSEITSADILKGAIQLIFEKA